jgi:hypothetical protein
MSSNALALLALGLMLLASSPHALVVGPRRFVYQRFDADAFPNLQQPGAPRAVLAVPGSPDAPMWLRLQQGENHTLLVSGSVPASGPGVPIVLVTVVGAARAETVTLDLTPDTGAQGEPACMRVIFFFFLCISKLLWHELVGRLQ